MVEYNDPAAFPFGTFAPNTPQQAIISLARRSILKRGMFRPMLARLTGAFREGPLDVQYHGASFRFYPQSSATERGALFDSGYNSAELDFLRRNVPAGGVFVDIGANVGTYALVLANHVGAHGHVIAVEPHPITQGRLAFNRAASNSPHIRLVAVAAGACDGELTIETDGDNLGASRIVTGKTSGNVVKVPAMRLQGILECADLSHVDALKIDVEGYEDRVLTGFFENAPQALWPRAIAIEHLSRKLWVHDCIADMIARGYAQIGATRSNTLLLRSSI